MDISIALLALAVLLLAPGAVLTRGVINWLSLAVVSAALAGLIVVRARR